MKTLGTNFLSIQEGDDYTFIKNCEKIIQNRIGLWRPKEVLIVDVNCYFDSAIAKYTHFHSSVFSFWSEGDRLRISMYQTSLDQSSLHIYESTYKGYVEISEIHYIKKRKKEVYEKFHSSYSYNPLKDGLMIWYSRNSSLKEESSIMIFCKDEIKFEGIHITFSKNKDWSIKESYGITKPEVRQIIGNDTFRNYVHKLD